MAENTICEDWEVGQTPLGFPAEMVVFPDGTKLSDFIATVVLKALNLSDIQDKSTARTNLDVYSKSESNSIVPLASDLIAGKVKLINDLTSNIVDAAVTAAQAKLLKDQLDKSAPISRTAITVSSLTNIDFTSIPTWVKKITLMFDRVSTNGTSPVVVRFGDAVPSSSGYSGSTAVYVSGVNVSNHTDGIKIENAVVVAPSSFRNGIITIAKQSDTTWVASGSIGYSDTPTICVIGYSKTLAGALNMLRVTTENGTDLFDSGSINITYE